MKHTFSDPDLIALDRIWPLGQQLAVPENGTIVVAGAYEGRYCHYLSEMFPKSMIYGFEPQPEAFLKATKRLHEKNVTVFNYGLGTANRNVLIDKDGTDGASTVSVEGKVRGVQMQDVVEVLHERGPVELFVMNMEASEWVLIPHLLDEMMHHRIKSFAIQFHPAYVSPQRAERVRDYLLEYYNLEYSDTNNWTYWTRR